MFHMNHKNCLQYFLAASLAAHLAVAGIFSSIPLNPGSTTNNQILEVQLLPNIVERMVMAPSKRQEQPITAPALKAETKTTTSDIKTSKQQTESSEFSPQVATNVTDTPNLIASLSASTPEQTVSENRKLDVYIQSLTEIIGRKRIYPRLARLRGWEGTATLRLRLLPGGLLHEVVLENSSGHDVLDEQALKMARQLSSWPLPPDDLRRREISVLVPVEFRLEK